MRIADGKSSQINSIQYLRGLAAIVVVIRHLLDRTEKYNIIAPGFNGVEIGLWGVDLFFVISGFVMVYITQRRQFSFKLIVNFWLRRFLRISPLYYIMTVIMLIGAFYMPQATQLKPSVAHTLASFLYLPTINPLPVLAVGWTLNYEMYFYLIFGCVLFLPSKYQIQVLSAWISFSVILGFFYHSDNLLFNQITNQLLIEFLLGVLAGRLYLTENFWSVTKSLIIISISFFIIIFAELVDVGEEFRSLIYGIPCAGLVSSLIMLEAKNIYKFDNKFLLLAGNISYSLYLVHLIVIVIYGKIVMTFLLFDYVNGYILLFGDFIVCILTAILTYKLIEQPLHSNATKRLNTLKT